MLLFGLLLFTLTLSAQDLESGRFYMNPNGVTPLSGVFRIGQTNQYPITVRVRGKTPNLDIAHTYAANYGDEFPIHGLYPGYSNIVQVEQNGRTRTFRVRPVDIPEKANIPTEVLTDSLEESDPFNQDLFFVNVISQRALMAFDRAGDIRYILNKDIYYYIHTLYEGGRLVVHNTEKPGDYVRMDLLGKEIQRFSGERYHHDSTSRGRNTLILAMSRWGWEDSVIEAGPRGRVLRRRFLGDALRKAASPEDESILRQVIFDDQNIGTRGGTNVRVDWAHVNGLAYDSEKDILILSTRHQGLMALRWSSWDLLWWMADDSHRVEEGAGYARIPKGAKTILDVPSLQKYRLRLPKGQGPKNQHAPLLTSEGTILVFDNNGDMRKSKEASHGREYRIEKGKAQLLRTFTHPKQHYSRLSSDIDLTAEGYWMMLWAESYPNNLTIIDKDNTILYDLSFKTKQLFYRADKMPLYPYQDGRPYNRDQNALLGL